MITKIFSMKGCSPFIKQRCLTLFKQRCLPLFMVAVIFMPFLLAACSKEKQLDDAELAGRAADHYYHRLMEGGYDEFVAGMDGADGYPESYRQQLAINAKQYMAGMKTKHSGMAGIAVARAEADSLGGYTNVFMIITFADSVREEIVVPMVKRNNEWKMK